MPPEVENIATLIAKRDIAIASLDELFEEFSILYQVEPELIALETVNHFRRPRGSQSGWEERPRRFLRTGERAPRYRVLPDHFGMAT